MPPHKKIINWLIGLSGSLLAAALLWLAATVWATKADASSLTASSGRIDTLAEECLLILQRLDRIEAKLDAILSSPSHR